MDFGSKFVYYYNQSDEDSVSDDSEEEWGDGGTTYGRRPVPRRPIPAGGTLQTDSIAFDGIAYDGMAFDGFQSDSLVMGRQQTEPRQKKKKKVRKSDPNVFTIDVAKYAQPAADVHPNSKRIICTNCNAVMTSFSTFNAGDRTWICEFCQNVNSNLDVTDFTKPPTNDVTFLLKEAEVVQKTERPDENHNVLFVIDISGSMGTTKEMNHRDANGRHTRTYVSRLDAVKKAAEHQIRQLKDESPNVRVGLIAFGSEVQVYGDGQRPMVPFNGYLLENQAELKKLCEDLPSLKPISETFDKVIQMVALLDVRGNTALGPGLWSALTMAANIKGSKVIICTDGCANNGIGTLPTSDYASEEEITACRDVYKGFGNFAKDNGTTVSVISMEGTDCKLVHLGMVAQVTGGIVDIVDPSSINDQFGNILTSKTVAVDVTVSLCLHSSLYVRDRLNTAVQSSTKVEHLGNVTEGTDMAVEFGVKTATNENEAPLTITEEDQRMRSDGVAAAGSSGDTSENLTVDTGATSGPSRGAEARSFNMNIVGEEDDEGGATITEPQPSTSQQQGASKKPSELPFQMQMQFETRSGAKYLRVVTIIRECTDERAKAEAEINMDVVGAAASKNISEMGLDGDYSSALSAVRAQKKLNQRAQISRKAVADTFDEELYEDADCYYMDDLCDLEGMVSEQRSVTKAKSKAMAKPRGSAAKGKSQSEAQAHYVDDRMAMAYYQRQSHASENFQKKRRAKK